MRVRPGVLKAFALANGCMLALLTGAAPVRGQGGPSDWTGRLGVRLIPVVTHATPAIAGEDRTELYLTQPVLMVHAGRPGGRIAVSAMLNLEGATIRRGELNVGIWGEGYVDRRHPHTYLHELAATGWVVGNGSTPKALSLTAGRGFAPFGTDDPMSRLMVKFPANHHLSQLLERWVAIAAVRAGAAVVEAGLFNGNEPNGPEDLAGIGRFGDSWATRVTIFPTPALELQGSASRVTSPELPPASESEHRKWSVSARAERSDGRGGEAYALVEWARTEETFGGERSNDFRTVLAEGALQRHGIEAGARLERTSRPEEERLADPFRTPVPHTDVHLLGVTRWHILSARLALTGADDGRLRARPFVEVTRASVREELAGQFFDPVEFFGDDTIWNLSAGIRLEAGVSHGRMGRYGAALARSPAHAVHHQSGPGGKHR